jgi:hypothetical protein
MSNELMSGTLLLEPRTLLVEPEKEGPELGLVDSEFAPSARALLERDASVGWLQERGLDDEGRRHVSDEPASPAIPEDQILQARRRLMDAGIASDSRGSMIPRGRRYRRRATLIPAFSAATSVVLLVLQLCVANGTLG